SGILSGRMGRVAMMPGHPSLMMVAGLACGGLVVVAVAAALLKPFVKGDHHRRPFDEIPMGIYRTAPDGRLLMANPHLVRMLGHSDSAELLEHKLAEAGARPEQMEQTFQDMIDRNGQVRGLEYTWSRRDGSALQVRENAKAVYGATGKLL